jgi:hypothetical protein
MPLFPSDHLSPLLFNIAADVVAWMVSEAQNNGHITGLVDNLIPKGVVILQYANDTILCLQNSEKKLKM